MGFCLYKERRSVSGANTHEYCNRSAHTSEY